MEAVAAFGLAANILQVVDFAHKLLSTSRQIYQAGSTVQSSELEMVAKDFAILNKRLTARARFDPSTEGPLTEDVQSLNTMALESENISQELLETLTALRLDQGASKYKSFVRAFETAWSSKKVAETKQRLDDMRKALHFHLQVTMRDDILLALDDLDDTSRNVLVAVLQSKADIVSQQRSSDALALRRHEQVINKISDYRGAPISAEDVLSEIKARLHHQRQDDRFDDIDEAHRATFRWALQSDDNGTSIWPNLYEWLRHEKGIYWISGKAGSGKSTLMKFLGQDRRLQEALDSWAGGVELLIIKFYFWNAGTDLQKSQEGLFRSMLYQVLDHKPSLGQKLFPEQYARGARWTEDFTFHQIRRAFRRLTANTDSLLKVAMLIDGLDEFDAADLTMAELAELFIAITDSPNIKAVLSSRPLAPFESLFRTYPKLRLHELTHKDITTYVHDTLARHPRVADLSVDHADAIWELNQKIVESASGVFLWVKLAVRSILEGLHNYDTLQDLEHRLRVLPQDLEDMFRHMLKSVPADRKTQSSRIFQVFRRYEELLTTGKAYHLYSSEVILGVQPVTMYFSELEQGFVLKAGIAALTPREVQSYNEEIEGRLRVCCAGLLVVRNRTTSHPFVEFFHKSAADFLAKEEVWCEITSRTSETEFDPNIALLQAVIMHIKHSPPDFDVNGLRQIWDRIRFAIVLAKYSPPSSASALVILLDELDKVMSTYVPSLQQGSQVIPKMGSWCDWLYELELHSPAQLSHNSFLALNVWSGVTLYVQHKLRELRKSDLEKLGKPLLHYACRNDSGFPSNLKPDMVALLLEHGADPNKMWRGNTSWSIAILEGRPWDDITDMSHPEWVQWLVTLQYLVRYGADPNMLLNIKHLTYPMYENREDDPVVRRASVLRWLEYEIPWSKQDKYPEIASEAAKLFQLLVSKGARKEEWHETQDGTLNQVYPEQQQVPTPAAAEPSRLEKSRSTGNIIKRLGRRLQRPRIADG